MPQRPRTSFLDDDDPATLGVREVIETEKLPRVPTDERASGLVGHRLCLALICIKSRDSDKESISGLLA